MTNTVCFERAERQFVFNLDKREKLSFLAFFMIMTVFYSKTKPLPRLRRGVLKYKSLHQNYTTQFEIKWWLTPFPSYVFVSDHFILIDNIVMDNS